MLILLTDGVNNCGKISPETAAEASKALGMKLYAIGAGTNGDGAGAGVRRADRKRRDWIRTGKPMYMMVQVQFDEAQTEAGGANRGRTLLPGGGHGIAAEYFLRDRQAGEIDGAVQEDARSSRDLYPWFLMAGLALVALEMVLSQTVWRKLP